MHCFKLLWKVTIYDMTQPYSATRLDLWTNSFWICWVEVALQCLGGGIYLPHICSKILICIKPLGKMIKATYFPVEENSHFTMASVFAIFSHLRAFKKATLLNYTVCPICPALYILTMQMSFA